MSNNIGALNITGKQEKIPLEIGIKFWIQGDNKLSVGPGDVKLIKSLIETKNLTQAAKLCGYSYKYAWQKIKKISVATGRPIAITQKGGSGGGGGVTITDWGKFLVDRFEKASNKLDKTIQALNSDINAHPFIEDN